MHDVDLLGADLQFLYYAAIWGLGLRMVGHCFSDRLAADTLSDLAFGVQVFRYQPQACFSSARRGEPSDVHTFCSWRCFNELKVSRPTRHRAIMRRAIADCRAGGMKPADFTLLAKAIQRLRQHELRQAETCAWPAIELRTVACRCA